MSVTATTNPLPHPVLMLTYHTTPAQLDLTRQAIRSVLAQDCGPLDFHLEDDGSTVEPEFWELLGEYPRHPDTTFTWNHRPQNDSPIAVLNQLLDRMFRQQSRPYVFIVNNDVLLPPNCFSQFLRWPRGIVCATDIEQQALPPLADPPVDAKPVAEIIPMTVSLLRRWVWEAVVARDGYFFDEGYFCYAADCDLALRVTACGIRGLLLDIPFWHFGSASHKLATPEIAKSVTDRADQDRAYFAQKYGFPVNSWQYGQVVQDLNLR
jgi:hypothetical protein